MTGHLTEGHRKAQKAQNHPAVHLCIFCLFVAILRVMPKKNRAGDVTTVGLVQMSCDPKPEANLKKAIAGISDAAKRGAQIVCLQELFRSQYFCQTEDIQLFKLAETIPGPSIPVSILPNMCTGASRGALRSMSAYAAFPLVGGLHSRHVHPPGP